MIENQTVTRSKRLLLLVSPTTYRAEAFMTAARSLDVEIVRGIDIPDGLRETWDVPLALDFTNSETALRHLVDYCRAQPVDAIVALDDNATLLATRAAAALGLPHNPLEAAEAARDKGLMRERFAAYGVPSPVFRRVPLASDPQEIAGQVRYPCVVKPLRLNGSKGVIRADDPLTFVAAFTRLRRILVSDGYPLDRTEILVEDYLPGGEVALEGLLTDGQLHVLALFDKPDPLEGPFFEETIYVTPSRLPAAVQDTIADCAARAAAALGLREGPLHAELRVNERGPWMLEIAGRSIGGLCSSVLEFGTGMCLEELILRHALGFAIPSFDRAGLPRLHLCPCGGSRHGRGGAARRPCPAALRHPPATGNGVGAARSLGQSPRVRMECAAAAPPVALPLGPSDARLPTSRCTSLRKSVATAR